MTRITEGLSEKDPHLLCKILCECECVRRVNECMCRWILRDRVKAYIMVLYVKEKKKPCTFPIYSIIIFFIFYPVRLYIVHVESCQSIVCFIYVYLPRGPVQCILECSLRLHNRQWLSFKSEKLMWNLWQEVFRIHHVIALINDAFISLWNGLTMLWIWSLASEPTSERDFTSLSKEILVPS